MARVLREIADLLEVNGENAFRIRAYRNAARVVEELPHPVRDAGHDGRPALTDLAGIGKDLADKGIDQARRGCVERRNAISAPPLPQLMHWLKRH